MEYPPETAYQGIPNKKGVNNFRTITHVKDDDMNILCIYTEKPDANLYTEEIDNVVKSITPIDS